ncbi:hypothetical protein PROFUN_08595 [Planoprotostelium fungivorum]|uniref:Uncharacterized protein n=1 Tax=Planoprotostelium fungivorum TaxID=1890364 RepID=A0A2P6NJ59_9EUKA|nr:hypothetical protein PROFUN_08595 [Planoprotostelium fungivorum]
MSSKKSSNCCGLGDLMTSHPMCVLREAEIRSTLLISRGNSNIQIDMEALEIGLLLTDVSYFENLQDDDLKTLLIQIIEGQFDKVFQHARITSAIDNVRSGSSSIDELDRLLASCSSLLLFIQANYTGPSPSKELLEKYPTEDVKKKLQRSGEQVYNKAVALDFLYLIDQLTSDYTPQKYQSLLWWRIRSRIVHQSILSENTEVLQRQIEADFDALQPAATTARLQTILSLEKGLNEHHHHQFNRAKAEYEKAREKSGLEMKLTGALGVRTKFQSFQVSQLVLDARSRDTAHDATAVVPERISHEDDTYLDLPKFEQERKDTRLDSIDQCIILAQCLNIRSQNAVGDGLTHEEMMPYVTRVLQDPNNWLIHSMALLIKSRLESTKNRTSDKAALQMQVLVDQFEEKTSTTITQEKEKTEVAVVGERLRYFFTLDFPSRWNAKREMGKRFLALGAAATAREIFEELEMWDEVIQCYRVMDQDTKAEALVRKMLDENPTPLLHCILGDITGKAEHYLTSWEISGNRFSRAKRSLGRAAIKNSDWPAAIQHFEDALAINPLFSDCWFSLGCSYMRTKEWQKAIYAFQRVISIKPEEGEAWANMATVYISMGQKRESFLPLQEAIKYMRSNWKIWDNYVIICMDLKEYQQAIYALKELLDMKDSVDIKIIGVLCRVIATQWKSVSHLPEEDENRGVVLRLREKLEALLEAVANKKTDSSDLWGVYADYFGDLGDHKKRIEYLEKSLRASRKAGWEVEEPLWKETAEATYRLADAYVEEGSSQSLFASKSALNSLIGKARDIYGLSEEFQNLENMLEKTLIAQRALKK